MRKKGNIIMIAPRDEIATREKLEFESKQQINELEPPAGAIPVELSKSADVARLLAGLPPLLLGRQLQPLACQSCCATNSQQARQRGCRSTVEHPVYQ